MLRVRLFLAALVVGSLLLTAAPALAAPTAWAGGSGCSQFYVVQPGDNLFRIGLRFGTSAYYLQQLNGLANPNYIYAGQVLCVRAGAPAPGTGGFYYRVQPGDTLYSIGVRFGWSYWYLASVNHLPDVNCIYVGEVLWIPPHY